MKRIKKFLKNADPVTLALIALLGVSSVFAWVQIAGTRGGSSVPVTAPIPSIPEREDISVFAPTDVPEEVPTVGRTESFIVPIDTTDYTVTTTFFDSTAEDATEVVSSIFFFQVGEGKYSHQSNGASFADTNGGEVAVVAPLSGTVASVVDDDPVRGTIVTIDHAEGIQTVLTGVYDVIVATGETITQGQSLGVTGLSRLEPDSGNVVHLEVIQDGNYLNPESIIGKNINDL